MVSEGGAAYSHGNVRKQASESNESSTADAQGFHGGATERPGATEPTFRVATSASYAPAMHPHGLNAPKPRSVLYKLRIQVQMYVRGERRRLVGCVGDDRQFRLPSACASSFGATGTQSANSVFAPLQQ